MESSKKTHGTRVALLVLAAVAMLLSGLFIATATRSDAQVGECPTGFNLTADGDACFQNASTTVTAPTCAKGQLTPDGAACFVEARVIGADGATSCPAGYSPDDSLGGTCARFEPAVRAAATCPAGARGVPGSCYTLVALGPVGAGRCSAADAALGGVVSGDTCVITGAAPIPGPGTCPVSSTVILDGSTCYQVITPIPNTDPVECTAAADLGLVNGECRRSVALIPGAPICSTGFVPVAGKCVRFEPLVIPEATCPAGSSPAADGCRRPVADTPGAWTCPNGGALNVSKCWFTTGFLVDTTHVLYACDAGTKSVVAGTNGPRVICLLDAPTTMTLIGCLRGTLSTDSTICLLPLTSSVPAPLPAFTG